MKAPVMILMMLISVNWFCDSYDVDQCELVLYIQLLEYVIPSSPATPEPNVMVLACVVVLARVMVLLRVMVLARVWC